MVGHVLLYLDDFQLNGVIWKIKATAYCGNDLVYQTLFRVFAVHSSTAEVSIVNKFLNKSGGVCKGYTHTQPKQVTTCKTANAFATRTVLCKRGVYIREVYPKLFPSVSLV